MKSLRKVQSFLGWVVFGFLACVVGSLGWILLGYSCRFHPNNWSLIIAGIALIIGSTVAIVWPLRRGEWNLRFKGVVWGLGLFLAGLLVAVILLNIFAARIMMVIP